MQGVERVGLEKLTLIIFLLVSVQVDPIEIEGTIQGIFPECLFMELPLVIGVRSDTRRTCIALDPNSNGSCRSHVEPPKPPVLGVQFIEKSFEMVRDDLRGVWGAEKLPIEPLNQNGVWRYEADNRPVAKGFVSYVCDRLLEKCKGL
jgi:hypothetical protein